MALVHRLTLILSLPCQIRFPPVNASNCFHLGWRPGTTTRFPKHHTPLYQWLVISLTHFGPVPLLRSSGLVRVSSISSPHRLPVVLPSKPQNSYGTRLCSAVGLERVLGAARTTLIEQAAHEPISRTTPVRLKSSWARFIMSTCKFLLTRAADL